MPQGDDRSTNEIAPDAVESAPASAPSVPRSGFPGMPASMPPLPPSMPPLPASVGAMRAGQPVRSEPPPSVGLRAATPVRSEPPPSVGLRAAQPVRSEPPPGVVRAPVAPLPPQVQMTPSPTPVRVEPSTPVRSEPPPPVSSSPMQTRPPAPFPPKHSPWRTTIERTLREIEARAEHEPTRAALLLAAQARICADGLGDHLRAQQSLDRASDLAPGARFVETVARMVAEQGKDAIMLLARIRGELQHVGDGDERVALLWQAAAIEEYVAFDFGAAQRTLGEILTLQPNDTAAWEALGALFLRTKAADAEGSLGDGSKASDEVVFEGAVSSLEAIATTTDDTIVRAALFGAVGALRDRWLESSDPRSERAVGALRRALDADPTNVAAAATLEGILLRRRAWDEYAQLVESAAARLVNDPRAAASHYERAGDVFTECLHDHVRAAHCFIRAAHLNGADATAIEKLVRVLETAGRWDEAAQTYELMLTRITDPAQRAWAYVGLGTVLDRRLHRYDDALAAFQAAVDASPTFAPATVALLQLARTRGLTALVIDIERTEVERIADPLARAVKYAALADLVELNGGHDAPALYERALGLDPMNVEAFDALDRLYRASDQWAKLATLYENALAATADKRRARALRLELGEILHVRLHQPKRAATHLRAALDGPEDRFDTLVALGRALSDAGSWTELVEALEAQASMLSGPDEVAAVYRIGHVLETRVQDLGRALATYEIVVDRAPRHEGALRAILRIHETESRWEKVIDAERKLLELTEREEDVVEGLLRIARIAEEQLGRLDEAILAYGQALEHAPTYAPALAALERLLRATANYNRLTTTLERFADATTDRHVKVRTLLRAAMVAELSLNDAERATRLHERALETAGTGGGLLDDDRHAALLALYRLHETRSAWADVDRTLLTLLETTTEPAARLSILARLARNTELRLGDIDRAAAFVDESLEVGAPAAAVAVDRLRLARLGGATDAIGASLGAMASSTTDTRLSMSLLRVRAILEEHTNAPAAAASIYERLVAHDGEDVHALEGLARTAGRFAGDARTPGALLARSRMTADPGLRAILAFAAGIVDDGAVRTREAEEAYAFALATEPDLLPVIDASRRLRVQASDWEAVAPLAERAAVAARDRENVAQSWLEAAKVYEDRLHDSDRALAAYRALLATQPEHALAHERAIALVEAVGEWATAEQLLLAHAEAVTDTATKVSAYGRRAALLAGRLHDVPSAIADLRKAIALRPGDEDPTLLEVLALLEEKTKSWQEALALHRRTAKATTDLVIERRARLAEARIHADELRDLPTARKLLEDLAENAPDDRDVLLRLASVASRGGDETRALEIYGQLTSSGSGPDKARGFLALYDLKRSRPELWPPTETEAVLARAFDLALADPSVIPVLEERAIHDGDFRPFAVNAESAIHRVSPTLAGVLPMRLALAKALREQLGDPTAADRHLQAAINAFPDSMPTRLVLAKALRGRNDDAALAELRSAVQHDPTAPEPFEALVTLAIATGRPGIAAMLASAAALLGGSGDEAEVTINDGVLRPQGDSLRFEEAMTRLVGPSRAWLVRQLLAHLEPFLPKLFPGNEKILEASRKLPDTHPVASQLRAVALALGTGPLAIAEAGTRDAMLLLTEPRAIVLGSEWLTDENRAVADFHLGYIGARVAGHGSLYVRDRSQIVSLIEAVARPENEGPIVRDLRKRVGSVLPRKNRKDLERLVEQPRPPEATLDLPAELAAWEAEESRRALTIGILVSRDLRAAAKVLATDAIDAPAAERRRAFAANPRMRAALEFVSSPVCWDAFKRLYGKA